jgi:hypothetical protein
MAGEQRRFGELLLEALEEMNATGEFTPGEIEARAAEVQRLLAQARREIDEEEAAEQQQHSAVTEEDIIAFFESGKPLTHAQQRLLFTDPRLRELFRSLKRQHAVALPRRGGGQMPASGSRVVEMPALIAAATDQGADFQRPFAGGTLRINPVGIDGQVYVVFSFDDPTIVTRVLIIERTRDERIERLELPAPDDGEIVLIKDLAISADADLVTLLRDPNSSGAFLRLPR